MPIFACGISYQSAPVSLRERVAFAPETLLDDIESLLSLEGVYEAMILTTCNRTEIYCDSEHVDHIMPWLAHRSTLESSALSPHWVTYTGSDAVKYIMSVACGLDSMIVGEPQVLGQMKSAFAKACNLGAIGDTLNRLFQRVFSVAKKVRHSTAVGACPVSLASTAIKLTRRHVDSLHDKTLLVLGAGDTAGLMVKRFSDAGIGRVIVANRSVQKAQYLADTVSGSGISLAHVQDHMADSDIVIAATASPKAIFVHEDMQRFVAERMGKPLFVLDVGVPRNIDMKASASQAMQLYCIDDLKTIIQDNKHLKTHAVDKAREMIGGEVLNYQRWIKSLKASGTISAYRQHVTHIRDRQLQEALRSLDRGALPEEVVMQLAHALSNKIMHKPSVGIRKASYHGRSDMLALAEELLGIKAV